MYVTAKFNTDLIDNNGRIMDDSLRLWNVNSTLKNATNIILGKLEGKQQQQQQQQKENIKSDISNNIK